MYQSKNFILVLGELKASIGNHLELSQNTFRMRYHLRRDSEVASNGESKIPSFATITFVVSLRCDSVYFFFALPDAGRSQRVEDSIQPA